MIDEYYCRVSRASIEGRRVSCSGTMTKQYRLDHNIMSHTSLSTREDGRRFTFATTLKQRSNRGADGRDGNTADMI